MFRQVCTWVCVGGGRVTRTERRGLRDGSDSRNQHPGKMEQHISILVGKREYGIFKK